MYSISQHRGAAKKFVTICKGRSCNHARRGNVNAPSDEILEKLKVNKSDAELVARAEAVLLFQRDLPKQHHSRFASDGDEPSRSIKKIWQKVKQQLHAIGRHRQNRGEKLQLRELERFG